MPFVESILLVRLGKDNGHENNIKIIIVIKKKNYFKDIYET